MTTVQVWPAGEIIHDASPHGHVGDPATLLNDGSDDTYLIAGPDSGALQSSVMVEVIPGDVEPPAGLGWDDVQIRIRMSMDGAEVYEDARSCAFYLYETDPTPGATGPLSADGFLNFNIGWIEDAAAPLDNSLGIPSDESGPYDFGPGLTTTWNPSGDSDIASYEALFGLPNFWVVVEPTVIDAPGALVYELVWEWITDEVTPPRPVRMFPRHDGQNMSSAPRIVGGYT